MLTENPIFNRFQHDIPTNVWVNVEDMMPPIGLDCLVYIGRTKSLSLERCYNDGFGYPTWADGMKKGQCDAITKWMFIEPPKSA